MLKPVRSILLLMSILAPILVCRGFLEYQIHMAKREVKEMIVNGFENKDLLRLTFSKQDSKTILNWEHAREFEYSGEKYDVVRSEENGDSLYYWCYHDHKETRLAKELEKWKTNIFNTKKENQHQKNRFEHFFKSLWISNQNKFLTDRGITYNKQYFYYCFHPKNHKKKQSFPPPKLA